MPTCSASLCGTRPLRQCPCVTSDLMTRHRVIAARTVHTCRVGCTEGNRVNAVSAKHKVLYAGRQHLKYPQWTAAGPCIHMAPSAGHRHDSFALHSATSGAAARRAVQHWMRLYNQKQTPVLRAASPACHEFSVLCVSRC